MAGVETVKEAVAVALWLSVTVSVNVALLAVHDAEMFAVTVPSLATTMPPMVTPLTVAVEPPSTVTSRVLAAWFGSPTVAIC